MVVFKLIVVSIVRHIRHCPLFPHCQ